MNDELNQWLAEAPEHAIRLVIITSDGRYVSHQVARDEWVKAGAVAVVLEHMAAVLRDGVQS